MRRQRTEVVVELRKVITLFYVTLIFRTTLPSDLFVWDKCPSLSWLSVEMHMEYYLYSLHCRTKETSTFWRGETCLMRTSVRTLMSTEISNRYGCVYSENVFATTPKQNQYILQCWKLPILWTSRNTNLAEYCVTVCPRVFSVLVCLWFNTPEVWSVWRLLSHLC